MELVTLAAACVATFAILFRYFERYRVALLPAIAINYTVAWWCGSAVAPPWRANEVGPLLIPACMLGTLFVVIFTIAGLSAKRAGVARTTIAGRMGLVLTIAGTFILFGERIGPLMILGIALALIGLVLTTATPGGSGTSGGQWTLPVLLFVCSGAADIGITYVQRTFTHTGNVASFPTLCFGASTVVSWILLIARKEQDALQHARTWFGGFGLGMANYASLLLLVRALDAGSYPASVIFSVMNILAILFATTAGMLLFQERLSTRQWGGLVLCLVSLALITSTLS